MTYTVQNINSTNNFFYSEITVSYRPKYRGTILVNNFYSFKLSIAAHAKQHYNGMLKQVARVHVEQFNHL